MGKAIACLAATVVAIGAVWAWLGGPVAIPQSQSGRGEKLYCLSYTPFRGDQTPLDLSTMIPAAQIDDDLARLAQITDCVRTYSVDFGLDQIARLAAKHGLKVMQGLWLSSDPEKNRYQIETAVAIANKYPGTVRSVVVGNEVLLRGDMTATDLANTIRAIKARVPMPVTYADVWEFWLRNRDVAGAVDFITIHILPYWEDFPIAASNATAHGRPTEDNAHPHATDLVAVVHNGIIENFRELRERLTKRGCKFVTETDSESIAHLVTQAMKDGKSPQDAVAASLKELRGAFALAFLFTGKDDLLIGARKGSPLAVGYGKGEMYLGSDAIALAPLTDTISYLEDGDWAVVTRKSVEIRDEQGRKVERPIVKSTASAQLVDKANYRHFMSSRRRSSPRRSAAAPRHARRDRAGTAAPRRVRP